jgi:hypothetical protein
VSCSGRAERPIIVPLEKQRANAADLAESLMRMHIRSATSELEKMLRNPLLEKREQGAERMAAAADGGSPVHRHMHSR